MKNLSLNQASVVSVFTWLVGLLITLVPAWSPEHQAVIAGGTAVIAAVFMLAHGIHNAVKLIHDLLTLHTPSADEVEKQVQKLVEDELRKRLGQPES